MSVYDQYAIPDSAKGQIHAFTRTSLEGVYRGALRIQMRDAGRPDRPLTLRDPQSLKSIDTFSQSMADSIVTTTNQMLRNVLEHDPTEQAAVDFMRRAADYNTSTLIPYQSATARSMAQRDFHDRNSINGKWSVVPVSTESHDACLDAIDASPMSREQAGAYPLPVHQNCPHAYDVTYDPSTLPPDLWVGE